MGFSSGPINSYALSNYFKAPYEIPLTSFYRGAGYVPNFPQNYGVPASGTISYENFRNSYPYPFDITTIVSKAQNLVNSTPSNLSMPPFSGNNHWQNVYWNGNAWIQISNDSWGGGDVWYNDLHGIIPNYFSLFNQMSNGTVLSGRNPNGNGAIQGTGNYYNGLAVGTLYTGIEGWVVNNYYVTGYNNSDAMLFDYLNAIIHNLKNTWSNSTINLQNVLNSINFGGSRTNFMNGIHTYVNWLYAN